MLRFLASASILFSCFVGASVARADFSTAKACLTLDVGFLTFAVESPGKGAPAIESVLDDFTKQAKSREMTVFISGPVLGSMDGRKVQAILECTALGFMIVATIPRSADYAGGILKNGLWRPQFRMKVRVRRSKVLVEATWKLRLTDGTEVLGAESEMFPAQKFPIHLTKLLYAGSGQQR